MVQGRSSQEGERALHLAKTPRKLIPPAEHLPFTMASLRRFLEELNL